MCVRSVSKIPPNAPPDCVKGERAPGPASQSQTTLSQEPGPEAKQRDKGISKDYGKDKGELS
jgi:hypothetical protein